MHIAILETGRINEAIADQFDRYPTMFTDLFGTAEAGGDFTFTEVPVLEGEFPASVDDFDGYLVTGSSAGVYDGYDWIDPLMDFIRQAHAADKPMVGVCFGHQVIAHALGGRTIKWHDGWGLGPYQVALADTPPWMPKRDEVRLIHIHQDQVVDLPPTATHLGSTSFCANAMFYIGNNVFCMQGHPEFSARYTDALLSVREDTMGSDRVAIAREGLKTEHEGRTIAGWILKFFTDHRAARLAA